MVLWVIQHQVDVEEHRRMLSQVRHGLRAEAKVWNEVSVHYVEMNPLPAVLIGQQKGIPQAGMIACKDRGGQYLFHQKGIYQE